MKIQFKELKKVNKLIINDYTVVIDKNVPTLPACVFKDDKLVLTIPTLLMPNNTPVLPINTLPFIVLQTMLGATLSHLSGNKGSVFSELNHLMLDIYGKELTRDPVSEDNGKTKLYQVPLDNGLWHTKNEIKPGVIVTNTFFAANNGNTERERLFKVVSTTQVDTTKGGIISQELKQTYIMKVGFGEYGFTHQLAKDIR